MATKIHIDADDKNNDSIIELIANHIKNNNIKLILVQGVPGSGKTTFARKIFTYMRVREEMVEMVAADDFFNVFVPDVYYADGKKFVHYHPEYRFNAEWLSEAHQYCKSMATHSLFADKLTIVHNTFTQDWEIENYTTLARKMRINYMIIRMDTQYDNVHGCPDNVVNMMKARIKRVSFKPDFIVE